jgi:hypothetical protein
LTPSFTAWTSSVSGCGLFTYTSTYGDGTSLNSAYITLTGLTGIYSIVTSNAAFLGIYTIKLTGIIAAGATTSITF